MIPADRAQVLELEEWEHNQAAAIMPKPTRPSAKWCIGRGCGERIPEERRAEWVGVQRCVSCQNEFEREQKRGRA